MIDPDHTLSVLSEVAEERSRQDDTWGQQDHPVHAPEENGGRQLLNGETYARVEAGLKYLFSQGARSMALIQLEEVMEALSAKSPALQREEFIQVAAVAVMIAESLDRAEAKKHGPGCELGLYHGGDCGPSAILRAVEAWGLPDVEPVPDTFLRRVVGPLDLTQFQTQFLDRVMRAPVSQDCPFCAEWSSRLDQVRSLADHIREDHPASEHGSRGPLMPGEGAVFHQEREGRVTPDPDSPVPGQVEVTFRDGPMKLTDSFKKKITRAVSRCSGCAFGDGTVMQGVTMRHAYDETCSVSVDEIHRTGGPGPEVARLKGLMKAVEEGRAGDALAGTPVPQVCGQEGCGPDYCPGGKQCRAMALGKADTSGD